MASTIGARLFRVILAIVGLLSVLIGINVGGGGILTLGLQGSVSFMQVTDQAAFLVRDSHIRYFGGLYLGVGLFLILAATNPARYQAPLRLVLVLIFLGGLARFTSPQPQVVFGPDIIGSLLAELVLMPLLFFWLPKVATAMQPHVALPASA